jgi:hypothetical protein
VEAEIKKGKTLHQFKQEKVLAKWVSGATPSSRSIYLRFSTPSLKNKPSGPRNSHGHIAKQFVLKSRAQRENPIVKKAEGIQPWPT